MGCGELTAMLTVPQVVNPLAKPMYWIGTPWTHLYASYKDHAFVMMMGIDTSTFHTILTAGFGCLQYTLSIFHPDATDIFASGGWQGRAEDRSG